MKYLDIIGFLIVISILIYFCYLAISDLVSDFLSIKEDLPRDKFLIRKNKIRKKRKAKKK